MTVMTVVVRSIF